tara:strand:+ start:456 stop:1205 length:750 start_codon:yes stop_codon:yes gene_type:complete
MTRVFGLLFEDGRNGILAIQPSVPFFGCQRYEQHFDVVDGAVDIDLLPTPAGVFYNVGFKSPGDTRRTDFTLRWTIPNQPQIDITPDADQNSAKSEPAVRATVYERVQLKRVADELSDSLEDNSELTVELSQAKARVQQLEEELRAFKRSTNRVLSDRDEMIALLNEKNEPVVKTVYLDKPVPPAALHERIKRLEQENLRLIELNAEYYKSVVALYQLQLDKARNSPQALPVEVQNSPQKRLLRKLLGK